MQTVIKIYGVNGNLEIPVSEIHEIGRITKRLDRAGAKYDIDFRTEGKQL